MNNRMVLLDEIKLYSTSSSAIVQLYIWNIADLCFSCQYCHTRLSYYGIRNIIQKTTKIANAKKNNSDVHPLLCYNITIELDEIDFKNTCLYDRHHTTTVFASQPE